MALYELSDKQITELGAFLSRVDIKGTEAVPFVSILVALKNPVVTPTEVSKVDDQTVKQPLEDVKRKNQKV